MARFLVHALGATAGGGANYLRNLLRVLPTVGSAHEWLVLAPPQTSAPPAGDHCRVVAGKPGSGGRFWFDQVALRSLIRHERIDGLLCTGNFGMVAPPVPQVLLSRNALYFSRQHLIELFHRRCWRELVAIRLRRSLALASIRASTLNIVPTAAMADQIVQYAPSAARRFRVIPHGFSQAAFQPRLDRAAILPRRPGVRRILMVSHYNYFRNFETLLRAFARLRQGSSAPLELVLTTRLGRGVRDHRYDTSAAAELLEQLGIGSSVLMLGTVAHDDLGGLYRTADVVVCPSYAESFGHPLIEAMATGRPIVASDLPVHREVAREAALYCPVFDDQAFAAEIGRVLGDERLAAALGAAGMARASGYDWTSHFAALVGALEECLAGIPSRLAA